MKRFEEYGHRDTRMASVETTINRGVRLEGGVGKK